MYGIFWKNNLLRVTWVFVNDDYWYNCISLTFYGNRIYWLIIDIKIHNTHNERIAEVFSYRYHYSRKGKLGFSNKNFRI